MSRKICPILIAILFAFSPGFRAVLTHPLGIQMALGANESNIIPNEIARAKESSENSFDTATRKKILLEVLQGFDSEVNDLKDKLNKFELNDDWYRIRENYLNNLSDYQSHYQELNDKIQSDITLEEIKDMAKDMKEWRENEYTPHLKEITNMVLIFEEENLLKIAKERNDKISADLKKLDKQKFIKTDILKLYYLKADQRLKNARDFNESAKNLFYNLINPSVEEKNNKSAGEESPKKNKIDQNSIRDLLKESLKELKATYELFFQMNGKLKNSQ